MYSLHILETCFRITPQVVILCVVKRLIRLFSLCATWLCHSSLGQNQSVSICQPLMYNSDLVATFWISFQDLAFSTWPGQYWRIALAHWCFLFPSALSSTCFFCLFFSKASAVQHWFFSDVLLPSKMSAAGVWKKCIYSHPLCSLCDRKRAGLGSTWPSCVVVLWGESK